jgi:hypothetical protein
MRGMDLMERDSPKRRIAGMMAIKVHLKKKDLCSFQPHRIETEAIAAATKGTRNPIMAG